MPIDPRHGRRTPSGRRFARALSRVFAATWEQVRPLIEQGYVPDAGRMREVVTRLALNALGVELVAGYARTMRGVGRGNVSDRRGRGNQRDGRRGLLASTKALRFDPGDGSFLPEPAAAGRMRPPTVPVAVGAAEVPSAPQVLIDWTVFRPEVRVEAERLALRLAGTIVEDTRRMIREQLSEGLAAGEPVAEIAKRIREVGFSPRRAATIAQTESSRAMHAGQAVAAKELGVTEWTWLASSDACPVCLSLDGKTVKIGDPFYVWPTGKAEYRVVYHAPAHPHCYCTNTEEMPE